MTDFHMEKSQPNSVDILFLQFDQKQIGSLVVASVGRYTDYRYNTAVQWWQEKNNVIKVKFVMEAMGGWQA